MERTNSLVSDGAPATMDIQPRNRRGKNGSGRSEPGWCARGAIIPARGFAVTNQQHRNLAFCLWSFAKPLVISDSLVGGYELGEAP
jgi:hypothetical protein